MSSSKKTVKEEVKKVEKKSKAPMIIGLLVLLGLGAFGAYYLLNNPGETTKDNTEPGDTPAEISAGNPQTPTEAYKKLFEAVKAKDTEAIKSMMSKDSMGLAQMQAGQSKKDISEVLKNAFSKTTFNPTLPAIRDERIKGSYGAIEVYIPKDGKWENVPFVAEDGMWKLAIGNLFAGSFKSPGESRSITEKKNANAAGKTDLVPYSNKNINMNVKPKIIDTNSNVKRVPPPANVKKVDPTTEKQK